MTTISFMPHQAGRKQLATLIAIHLEAEAHYLGTPSFAYQIGQACLDKDWVLHLPDDIDTSKLVKTVTVAGFAPLNEEYGLTLAFPTESWDEAPSRKWRPCWPLKAHSSPPR